MNAMQKSLIHIMLMPLFTLICHQTASAYYDPGVQRWINRDPLPERGFETRRFRGGLMALGLKADNEYACCRNNPINYGDPLGLEVDRAGYDGCMAQCAQDRKNRSAKILHAANCWGLGTGIGWGVIGGALGSGAAGPQNGVIVGGVGGVIVGGLNWAGVAVLGGALNLAQYAICAAHCAYGYLDAGQADPGGF
jgi:RHS repeat-associated protein